MLGTVEAVLPCIATCGKPVRLVEASYLQLVMQGTVVLLHLGTFMLTRSVPMINYHAYSLLLLSDDQ